MAKRKNKLTFEEAMEQLRMVVHELEDGNLSLSDSLEKYESGIGHLQQCYEDLAQAERKIKQLVRVDQEGKLITQPFDDKASHPIEQGDISSEKGYSDGKFAVKSGNKVRNPVAEAPNRSPKSDSILFSSSSGLDHDSDLSDDDDLDFKDHGSDLG